MDGNNDWEDHTPDTGDDPHAAMDAVYGDNWCQRLVAIVKGDTWNERS